jgi:ATP-binding cassette, subfamily B, bacterial
MPKTKKPVNLLNLLHPKLQNALAQLPYLPRVFPLVWRAARGWTIAWAPLLVLQGLLPVATVYLTRAVVDGLVSLAGAGQDWQNLRPVLVLIALMAGVLLLTELLRSLTTWIRTAQSERVQDHISNLIHAKAISLDLSFYETPAYYDHLHRARVDALNQPVSLLENTGSLLQNGLTLVAMAGVLIPFGAWIPLVLVVSAMPALWVALRYTLRYHEWRRRNTAAQRRTNYYNWLITSRESAAELRLFALNTHFQTAYQLLRGRLRGERVTLAQNQAFAEIAASGVALLSMGGAVAWMAWRAARGQVSLGDLALFYQAFNQGQRMMRTLLQNVSSIYGNSLFLENLFQFLELTPQVVNPTNPVPTPLVLQKGIEFQQVTFRYPGSQRTALHDFNLNIPAGQITAIVGTNGAGKSTLIKLLCRFYDAEAGRVLIDGTDLRDLSLDELWRIITVLFQEPVHYHDTAARNIAFGDFATTPGTEQIETAARAAGADAPISRLPEGYETLLGKWFGGVELSVGEWQRVALARAFLRQASIIVLDEPTSAMDSWAEADWMARFRKLVAGRTAVIITHRFTTAMQADIIHVMDTGQLVESGTHGELLAHNGRYAESWQRQMRSDPGELK